MNNIHLCSLLILCISTFISCKKTDWYEEKVDKSQSIPASLNDLKLLMSNHDILNVETPSLQEWASDGHVGDMSILPFLGSNPVNAYTWSNEIPYSKVLDWNAGASGGYVKVFYANLVLEKLVDISVTTQDEQVLWNNIKGHALFVRAKSFYDLAQLFAPEFSTASAESMGLPLRLTSDVSVSSVRSTLKETYDRIISDLKLAKGLMTDVTPSNPNLKSSPSRIAVDALLARVFLSMEDYDNAGLYSDSCLRKYNSLIDFNNLDSTKVFPFDLFNKEVIYHTIMSPSINTQFFFIEAGLYNEYHPNDLRRVMYFDNSLGDEFIRFKGTYDSYGGYLFSGLATDEIYLIRAECYARNNEIELAMFDLNTLLQTRWGNTQTFEPVVANSSEDALRRILIERERELLCRGVRWSDLRRLNKDSRFAKTITREFNGKTYVLEPNSYKYTFPIPEDVIQASKMKQNPGWSK